MKQLSRFLISPAKLHEKGMLGMNCRNSAYIHRYNKRSLYPLVDDKLKTKRIAEQAGIATPKLLAVIEYQYQVKYLEKWLADLSSFVIKPAEGSGGKGIKVIQSRDATAFIKTSGERVDQADVNRHVSNILSGLYSLGGKPDKAMIEQRVELNPIFENYSFQGIPDIRVIVFQGYPVMAMLRLSTHKSDGKANLHQGAVGVGICLATGRAISAVQHNKLILKHPDTLYSFEELQIPHWDELLALASKTYDIVGLGYLGVDIILDRNLGPLILELNARPGLAIQMANRTGLVPRLQKIESLGSHSAPVAERVAFSMEHFGRVKLA